MASLFPVNIKQKIISVFEKIIYILSKFGIFKFNLTLNFFYYLYKKYKLLFERNEINSLCSFIKPNSLVIDVGANIGIYSLFFAKNSDEKTVILSIEPEEKNFFYLSKNLKKFKKVKLIKKIASDVNDFNFLKINLSNPTAHSISDKGEKIESIKLDSFIDEYNKKISLIKIDVEGAEGMVLNGSENIIKRDKPVIYLEFSPSRIKKYNNFDFLSFFNKYNYKFYIKNKNKFEEITGEDLLSKAHGMVVIDVLCK